MAERKRNLFQPLLMRFNGTPTLLGFGRNLDDPCLTGRSKYLPFGAGWHQRAIGARINARYGPHCAEVGKASAFAKKELKSVRAAS